MAFPTALTVATDDSVPGAHDGTAITAALLNNIETKIGIDSSAVVTSIDYLLKNVLSIDPGHKHSKLWASDGSPEAVSVDASGNLDFKDVSLYLSDTDVAHGMTGNLPTDCYAKISINDSVGGGLRLVGASDTNSVGVSIWAVMGTGSTSIAPMTCTAYKADGTSFKALESGELAFHFKNSTTHLLKIYGDGNFAFNEVYSFGTSATKVLGIGLGTAPSDSPANMAQMWVEDINAAAGYAGLHKMTETFALKEIIPGVYIKTDTGSPANPYEGLIEINLTDNKVRMYADAGWRELGTW